MMMIPYQRSCREKEGGCQGGTSTGIFVDLGTTPTHFPHNKTVLQKKDVAHPKIAGAFFAHTHAGCVTQGTQRMCVRLVRRCGKLGLDEKLISKVRDIKV